MSRILTGITTTGSPHLGNYVGAIKPAIELSKSTGNESFLFMADLHALIKCSEPARLRESCIEIAATWLASGLDPNQVTFYRQSQISEISQFNWLLNCITNKGHLNRAHAYKAATDQNIANNKSADDGITLGLFSYPILMAADILLFDAQDVPVGQDQVQHIEIAKDIAIRFNHIYGKNLLTLPKAVVSNYPVLPGLDGRKMSKSYNNTIPLFKGGSKLLKKQIASIVTDDKLPGEPKDVTTSTVLKLYEALNDDGNFRLKLLDGMGWGDAKKELMILIDDHISPMRDRYQDLMTSPDYLNDVLNTGAQKARFIASTKLQKLYNVVGL